LFTFRYRSGASLLYDTVLKNVIILMSQAVNPLTERIWATLLTVESLYIKRAGFKEFWENFQSC
jgi:hypothetical protein